MFCSDRVSPFIILIYVFGCVIICTIMYRRLETIFDKYIIGIKCNDFYQIIRFTRLLLYRCLHCL